MKSKNLSVHALRGLSAFLVLLHHEFSRNTDYWNFSTSFIDLGRVGVVSFFLISGFVIRGSIGKRNISSFLFLRFFRLFPIYWLALMTYLVACNFASESAKDQASIASDSAFNVNVRDFVLNLTMFQEILGLKSMLPPAWTLSIELMFYLSVCILVAFKVINWEKYMLYGSLSLFAVINILEYVFEVQLPSSLPLLLAMAFLGSTLYEQTRTDKFRGMFGKETNLTLLIIVIFYSFGASDSLWNPVNRILSTVLGLGIFLAFLTRRQANIHPVFGWLGDISYSLYIISPSIMILCDTYLPNVIYKMIGSIVFTLLISTLTYNYIEKPLQKWSRIRAT